MIGESFPIVPHFTNLGSLGGGTFGEVIRARDELHGTRVVAIKWLTKRGIQHPHTIQDALAEIRVLRAIGVHPNIVRHRQSFLHNGHYFAVLEYCPNGTLSQRIEIMGGLPKVEAYHHFHHLLTAVDYLHGRGIAHMDIKPSNIVLDANNRIKLTDFGLAIMDSEETPLYQCRVPWGTLHYRAPEVAAWDFPYENTAPFSAPAADVWSCGVTLFHMLFASLPFLTEDIQGELFALIVSEIQWPENPAIIPEEARILLSRMFDWVPTNRYSMEQLKGISSVLINPLSEAYPNLLAAYLQVQPQ